MNKQEIELTISKISKKINLTKAGDNYKCRCPFHTEIGNQDGSLVINTDKNLYHCFGCGKGDTILSFLEEISREGDLND